MADIQVDAPVERPAVDIDALLAAAGLDLALERERITIIDDMDVAASMIALTERDTLLQKQAKAIADQREVIRKLIKERFTPGDELLAVAEGDGARPIAKMTYPEPTVRVDTKYMHENFPPVDHPKMWIRTESTPRLTVFS